MKTFLKGLIFIVGIISIGSCEKDKEPKIPDPKIVFEHPDQKIFFEHYYINYAWGFSYVHWIIDYQGNVRENKKKDSLIWISPDRLNEYLEMFDTVIYKIDKRELDYYINLIPNAANGEISKTEIIRRDFGGFVFNCYMQVNDSVKEVTLSAKSDVMDKTNLDSRAKKIDKWLKDLHEQIYEQTYFKE